MRQAELRRKAGYLYPTAPGAGGGGLPFEVSKLLLDALKSHVECVVVKKRVKKEDRAKILGISWSWCSWTMTEESDGDVWLAGSQNRSTAKSNGSRQTDSWRERRRRRKRKKRELGVDILTLDAVKGW